MPLNSVDLLLTFAACGRIIPGGAAQMLCIPLNPKKRLKQLKIETLSNDVVIGLMGVTVN